MRFRPAQPGARVGQLAASVALAAERGAKVGDRLQRMHGAELVDMRQHRPHAPCARLEPFEAQQGVQPDQPPARAVQPVDLALQILVGVALQTVGDQQHDGPAGQHPARPLPVEGGECRGDPRAARPVLHPLRAGEERLVRVLHPQLPRDIGQPGAEQERVDVAPLLGQRMHEMQQDAGVLAHRAGNVAKRDDGRALDVVAPVAQLDHVAAGAQRGAQGPARVDAPARRADQPAQAHLLHRQHHAPERRLGPADLLRVHLGEVLALQQLAARHGEAGIHHHLLALVLLLAFARCLEGLGDAGLAGLGLVRLAARRRHRREDRQQLLDQPARAPVDAEGLVEDGALFALAHEDRMQRPIEVLAVADAGDLDRAHRIDDAGRADRQSGTAQGPGEMHDVVGDASAGLLLQRRELVRHRLRPLRFPCGRGRAGSPR